jgi:hypothetical protein
MVSSITPDCSAQRSTLEPCLSSTVFPSESCVWQVRFSVLDSANLPDIADKEILTRYLMFSKWYRADQTIKYEAFMPPDDLEFSVTRLLQATDPELWAVGVEVAAKRGRTLHGRADLSAQAFQGQQLAVHADALPDNPNHAKVTDWPVDKAQQIIVAKQLAATPGLRRKPPPLAG